MRLSIAKCASISPNNSDQQLLLTEWLTKISKLSISHSSCALYSLKALVFPHAFFDILCFLLFFPSGGGKSAALTLTA